MNEKNNTHRLVVIGAGSGGYAAAFHAADLGVKVTLIDKEDVPGGVCLLRGCIPTKALLHVAKLITDAKRANDFGISFQKPDIDVNRLRAWKNEVVKKLTGGLQTLCRRKKVEYIQGEAKFINSNTLEVKKKSDSTEKMTFVNAILATGSIPATIPNLPPDSNNVLDSRTALEVEKVPESMLVIGGGYIGLELGTIYANLGTRVSLVEMTENLMPLSDQELVSILSKKISKIFESVMLNTRVTSLEQKDNGIKVYLEGQNIEQKERVYEKVLVAVGRKPNSANTGLENTKIEVDDKGFVKIRNNCRTDDASIYAVGDITGPPLLAHRATHQAIAAAKVIAGYDVVFNPMAIPSVVYTDPEIAECGMSEKQANEAGINIKVTKFPWYASGRAATLGDDEGLTKLIVDSDTERILGAGIVGTGAGELISEAALAVEMAAVATDLAFTIHPHPTLSETLMEAAKIFSGGSVHL
jgi:dihydrolipoamide dehydrogenase